MFKKNIIALVFLAVLVIIAAIIYLSNRNNTLDKKETDFSLTDNSQISSIKIKNNDSSYVLNKKNDKWYFNNEFRANSSLISLCLRIISQVEIKSSLPAKIRAALADKIKKSGSEIEIYSNNDLVKHYYLWADLASRNTYMMMADKENIPYMVTLPAFEGNFAAVFLAAKSSWRDLTLLEFAPKEISYIKVEKPEKLDQSFQIIIENDKVIIADIKYNKPIKYNQEAVSAYFYSIRKVYADKYIEDNKLLKQLLTSPPFSEIQISDKSGNLTDLKFYLKAKNKVAKGEKNKSDKNKCFAILDEKQLFICKYVNIDPIVRNLDFFAVK